MDIYKSQYLLNRKKKRLNKQKTGEDLGKLFFLKKNC